MASARHPITLTALAGLFALSPIATTSFALDPGDDTAVEPGGEAVVTAHASSTVPQTVGTPPIRIITPGSLLAGAPSVRMVSPGEADDEASAEWQRTFNLLAASIAADFPDDFTGATIEDPAGSGWIGFTASAPDAAVQRIAAVSGVRIVTDMGYTGRDAEAATLAAMDAVSAALGTGATVAASREGSTSEITVVYNEGTSAGPIPSVGELTQAAQQTLPDGSPLTVSVERATGPAYVLETN